MKVQVYSQLPNRLDRLEKFFADVSTTLSAEQRAKLAAIRQSVIQDIHVPKPSVRTLLKAARRIDLTGEQRDQLREIENEMMRAVRAARAANEDDRPVAVETRRRIDALLTPEQQRLFATALSNFERQGAGH